MQITSDIKPYLPESCQFDQVPSFKDTTILLFRQIQPTLPNSEELLRDVPSMDKSVRTMQEIAKSLEEGKDSETKHKVLSILVLALCVAAVAGVIVLAATGFVLPALLLVGALAIGGAFAHLASFEASEKYRANELLPNRAGMLGAWMGALTLGLSAPIHYITAAFTRRPHLEQRLHLLGKQVADGHAKMGSYIRENSAKMQDILREKKSAYERANLEITGDANLAQQIEQKIANREKALEELVAATALLLKGE